MLAASCGDVEAQSDLGNTSDGAPETSDATPETRNDVPQDTAAGDVQNDTTPDTVAPRDVTEVDTSDTVVAELPDSGPDLEDTTLPCGRPGAICNPIPIVPPFPYQDTRDTRDAPGSEWNFYNCAADVDESGGEFVYQLELSEPGLVRAELDDVAGDSVDIDIHILDALAPDRCLARGNYSVSQTLQPGTYYIVADTWVDGSTAMSGQYTVTVSYTSGGTGSCAVESRDLRMYWSSCAAGIDCYESGGEVFLRTPATGPVANEAHLVTTLDDFGGGWPTSATDGLQEHYAMSESLTGFVVSRTEPWAPAGEGGSEWGQGSGQIPPPDAEAWYVNMYWRDRPAPGTRMIITNPANGRAVVAAAGYETGPGSNTAIGGVVEEVHRHLGTSHRGELQMGFAVDQNLPYGPITCE